MLTRFRWMPRGGAAALLAGLWLAHCSSSSTKVTPDAGRTGSSTSSTSHSTAPCGAMGQACCGVEHSCDDAGLFCMAGTLPDGGNQDAGIPEMCAPCGNVGQLCCVSLATGNQTCSGTDVVCTSVLPQVPMDAAPPPAKCVACGATGQPCCPSSMCTGGGDCCDSFVGLCVGNGEMCSTGAMCTGGTCNG